MMNDNGRIHECKRISVYDSVDSNDGVLLILYACPSRNTIHDVSTDAVLVRWSHGYEQSTNSSNCLDVLYRVWDVRDCTLFKLLSTCMKK